MSVVHVEPVQPDAQLHVYPFTLSVHEPLFLHGFGEQSLMLVVQYLPVHPAGHGLSQLYALTPSSLQVPREQGFGEQSLTSVAHVEPVQPDLQVHVYPFTLSVHVALFLQGFGEQSLMLVAHVEPVQPGSQLHEVHLKPQAVHEPCTHGFGKQ
jgi:hypothetical protein